VVAPHRTLNTVKGVIKCPVIGKTPIDKLIEKLSPQAVTDIRRISVRRGDDIIETSTYVITFKQLSLPSHLKITSWFKVKVNQYIERPQQCYNCLGYGHVRKYCRRENPICAKCGTEGHSSENCSSRNMIYLHCGGPHKATDKNCKRYTIEMEILATASGEKISKYETKRLVLERTPQPGMLFSDKVKQNRQTGIENRDESWGKGMKAVEVEVEIHQQPMQEKNYTEVSPKKNNNNKL